MTPETVTAHLDHWIAQEAITNDLFRGAKGEAAYHMLHDCVFVHLKKSFLGIKNHRVHWVCHYPASVWDHWKDTHPRLTAFLRLSQPVMTAKTYHEEVSVYLCPHLSSSNTQSHVEFMIHGPDNLDVK